jgi:hypothetical protein
VKQKGRRSKQERNGADFGSSFFRVVQRREKGEIHTDERVRIEGEKRGKGEGGTNCAKVKEGKETKRCCYSTAIARLARHRRNALTSVHSASPPRSLPDEARRSRSRLQVHPPSLRLHRASREKLPARKNHHRRNRRKGRRRRCRRRDGGRGGKSCRNCGRGCEGELVPARQGTMKEGAGETIDTEEDRKTYRLNTSFCNNNLATFSTSPFFSVNNSVVLRCASRTILRISSSISWAVFSLKGFWKESCSWR